MGSVGGHYGVERERSRREGGDKEDSAAGKGKMSNSRYNVEGETQKDRTEI